MICNSDAFNSQLFYVGSLCKNGHRWGDSDFSLRFLSTDQCLECKRAIDKRYREKCTQKLLPQKLDKQNKIQEEKKKAQEKLFLLAEFGIDDSKLTLGTICRYGHDWNGTGFSLRYKSKNHCRECCYESIRRFSKTEKGRLSAKKCKQKYRLSERGQEMTRNLQKRRYHEKLKFDPSYKQKVDSYRKKPRAIELVRAASRRRKKTLQGKIQSSIDCHRRRVLKKQNHSHPFSRQELESHLALFQGCAYCGEMQGKQTIDHFIPISTGGGDCLSNIVKACEPCNFSKNNRDPLTWYSAQKFYDPKKWRFILKVLGKNDKTKDQLPLF